MKNEEKMLQGIERLEKAIEEQNKTLLQQSKTLEQQSKTLEQHSEMLTQLIKITASQITEMQELKRDVTIIKEEMPKIKRMINEHDTFITEQRFQ